MNENEKSPEKKEDFSLAEILSEYRAKAAAEGKDQYQIPEPKSAPAAPYAQNHLPTEEEVLFPKADLARFLAERTLSLASFTEASGRPTISKAVMPLEISVSTVISNASIPRSPRL